MRKGFYLRRPFLWLLFPFFLFLLNCSEEKRPIKFPEERSRILFGVVFTPEVNGRSLDAQIRDLKELGVDCAKFWLDWNGIEPRLAPVELSGDYLRIPSELIEEYAFPERPGSRFQGWLDYSKADRLIRALNANGIGALPLIADGALTPLIPNLSPKAMLAPEPSDFTCQTEVAGERRHYQGLGRGQYLARVYLFSAGLARRYSQGEMKIQWWNTENELNWTYIHTTVAGWRCGRAWSDQKFLTALLEALYLGIKAGNPEALSTMNVNIHDPDWISDLSKWSPFMDALGLGAYPNYLFALPKLDGLLTSAVKRAVAVSKGKQVFVLETGYPSGPRNLGWNEDLQAQYISESVKGAVEKGADAYIYFKLDDTALAISPWSLQRVENHWGLIRLDGSRKPSFYAYKDAIAKYKRGF